MLLRVNVRKKTYQFGGFRCYNCNEGGKVGRREQNDMALYSSEGEEKLMIIVSMMVTELKK